VLRKWAFSLRRILHNNRYGFLCRYEHVAGLGDPLVYIQITPAGRKLVRCATGEQREKPLPLGTLREWHWKADLKV
jgi:hypothetical protein